MPQLGVNIDHVATVRQARRTDEPDPVWAAAEAQLGGASCITFHLREDRRHMTDRDVPLLKEVVVTKLNMEMSIAPEIVQIARSIQPTQCSLVPEHREEITTEGGLDVVRLADRVGTAVKALKDAGIICSAFIEPETAQIEKSAELGFEAVELWTGGYANAKNAAERERALETLRNGIRTGKACGLEVHGGHGLTYRNVGPVAAIPGFSEFNIGHSIIARAIFVGLRKAVRDMVRLLQLYGPRE
ncbi:MAG TPA: pyridoxine 5'-phosphate synthase [Phycisphaerae bacterium]|nr:pyridoxine 5'-phosphate synthase [Phycisphaerae bacterium]